MTTDADERQLETRTLQANTTLSDTVINRIVDVSYDNNHTPTNLPNDVEVSAISNAAEAFLASTLNPLDSNVGRAQQAAEAALRRSGVRYEESDVTALALQAINIVTDVATQRRR